jgi:hypothetical protein
MNMEHQTVTLVENNSDVPTVATKVSDGDLGYVLVDFSIL